MLGEGSEMKMRYTLSSIYGLIAIAILTSCSGGQHRSAREDGDTLHFKYAEHLTVVQFDNYTQVELADPWNQGKTLHTYLLVPANEKLPAHLPKGTVLRTPLQKSVIATSVHCGLVMSFGKKNCIGGVCDLQYIHLPWIQQQCKLGKMADCGSGLSPTVEKIIDIQPDALFLSPFQNNGGYGRMDELGIPIVETADYMETSALGRAEWMKFYGMLFGAEREADSIFTAVEKHYLELKALAEQTTECQSMMMDKQTGSVWYVPGGNSTIGKLIVDASARYPWSDNENSGSVALPFETVLEKAQNADIWLFRYNSPQAATFSSLLSENKGYSQFQSFKNKNVYGCNTATSTFYEDTPFHPDLLLRDLVIIAHPSLKEMGDPTYFKKIKE